MNLKPETLKKNFFSLQSEKNILSHNQSVQLILSLTYKQDLKVYNLAYIQNKILFGLQSERKVFL